MPGTVTLHRVFTAKPEKVYRAFLEPDAVASWLPPFGFVCTVHELEAKKGGRHRMSFRNFTTGSSHSFGGEYLDLIPGEKLVYTERFDDQDRKIDSQSRRLDALEADRSDAASSAGSVRSRATTVASRVRAAIEEAIPPRRQNSRNFQSTDGES